MKELNIKLTKPCPECGGCGRVPVLMLWADCKTCHGTGEVPRYYTPEEVERFIKWTLENRNLDLSDVYKAFLSKHRDNT